ncbi:M23 family metallopeptidase [Sphingomonas flavalba]|uniref:M23 family metallopeptidase n=1 Tax=Sphingomonas flavalba TaxID=2559804 RepID=UPI00109DBEA9|nr:M23 family metallopeptidase [Sphingomonas flavalba]
MRDARRRAAVLLSPFVIAGCTAIPQAAPEPPPPVPVIEAVRDTRPPPPAAFSFEGAFVQGGLVVGTAPTGTIRLVLDGQPVAVSADGRFVIGFDRDAAPGAMLVATLADGRTHSERLAVAPGAWAIERVDIARSAGTPSEAFRKLRAPELARINAARRINATSDGWRQRFLWPVRGRISGVFGSQRIYRGEPGAYHSGVDVAPGGSGATVVAPADGVVVLATEKPFTLEGNLVIIDHGMSLNSAFLHLARIDVKEGQSVRRGDPIGTVGMTGRATGPHLHWSMKWRAARIDPQPLAGPMP